MADPTQAPDERHVCCGCGGLCDSGEPCPMAEICRCRSLPAPSPPVVIGADEGITVAYQQPDRATVTAPAPSPKPTAGEWETSWAKDRKVRFAPTDHGSVNVTEATESGRWAVLNRDGRVAKCGDADPHIAHAMRAADAWAREHAAELDWQMPPKAPAAREPAPEATVAELISAIDLMTIDPEQTQRRRMVEVDLDLLERALAATDDNTLRRMLAAVKGGTHG